MIREIFYPTPQNVFIWLSASYLLVLLYFGKVSPVAILFVYFLETIIIGIFNALKILWCAHYSKSKAYALALFFLVHYGAFVAVQSGFGFALFDFSGDVIFKDPFNILKNYGVVLNLQGIKYALAPLIFIHLKKFVSDFIYNEKFRKFTPKEVMIKPYIRIFIQQFVVIISFFFIVFNKGAYVAATLLIIFRLILDLVLDAIKENSQTLDALAEKLSNDKESPEQVKKKLILFTE